MNTAFIVIGLSVLLIVALGAVYNAFIRKKNMVANAFSSVEVMLKKRYDLIPNLVDALKAYTAFETNVLTRVTELRGSGMQQGLSQAEIMKQDTLMTQALRELRVTVEAYPDLKANENFIRYQASLNDIEEQISAARRTYNAAVNAYNNAVEVFPLNLLAGVMGFTVKPFFQIEQSEAESKRWFN